MMKWLLDSRKEYIKKTKDILASLSLRMTDFDFLLIALICALFTEVLSSDALVSFYFSLITFFSDFSLAAFFSDFSLMIFVGLMLITLVDFMSVFANFFATFIGVMGLLSLMDYWQGKKLEDNLKGQWDPKKNVFVNCSKEDEDAFENLKKCLGDKYKYGGLSSNNADPNYYFPNLKKALNESEVTLILCSKAPKAWLTAQLSFCSKLGVNNKVIVLGNLRDEDLKRFRGVGCIEIHSFEGIMQSTEICKKIDEGIEGKLRGATK